MTSAGELRQQVQQAKQEIDDSLGALKQGRDSLEGAQQTLQQAGDGSSQGDFDQAVATLAGAISAIDDAMNQVNAASNEADGIAARL